jgi:sugar lactone lactonase YvrE
LVTTQARSRFALVLSLSILASAAFVHAEPARVLFTLGGDTPTRSFKNPSALFYDTGFDHLYIADTGNHRIAVIDRDGYPLHSIPHFVTRAAKRIPGEPKSVAVDGRGWIYVVDALSPDVDVIDAQGIQLGRITPSELLPGDPALTPEAVMVDGHDRVYVAVDGHYSGVLRLDEAWGLDGVCPESGQGEPLQAVSGLWVDDGGEIAVVDPVGVPSIRVFDSAGRQRLAFGTHDVGFDNFSRPSSVAVDGHGTIWVVDMIRQVAKAFSSEGRYESYVGGRGAGPGALNYPSAATTDGRGRLYVVSRQTGDLVCYEIHAPRQLAELGDREAEPGRASFSTFEEDNQ